MNATPRVVLCEGAASNRRLSVGVTPMELAFGIDSSVGCWMIVSLLAVPTNIAAPDADASDEDGTAAHVLTNS